MSNVSFHGTDQVSAMAIVGPPSRVDVNLGKGELGKGFYTGSSIALAAIWAQIRYDKEAVVIKFHIPEENFVQLKAVLVKTRKEVVRTWNELQRMNETTTYVFGHDYVIAPFATIEESGHQLKFESKKAEDELNASHKQIFPCAF